MENQDGLVVLSKQRADFVRVWDRVKDAHDTGQVVEGKLVRKIKGGVVVDLYGVEAFLPGSQIALRQVQNVDALLGQTVQVKIIKLNKRRRNIVVSRRAVLEEERDRMKATILKDLAQGPDPRGRGQEHHRLRRLRRPRRHRRPAAHHRHVVGPRRAPVRDRQDRRQGAGQGAQLRPREGAHLARPEAAHAVPVGGRRRASTRSAPRVKGKVVSITDYGAFVELEKGVEGLIHVSEMSWTRHVRHPSKVVNIGDIIEAVVLKVDKDNEKISLGLKQVEPDPWLTLDEQVPGRHARAAARSATSRTSAPSSSSRRASTASCTSPTCPGPSASPTRARCSRRATRSRSSILSIDKEHRRISLGLKQVQRGSVAVPGGALPVRHGAGRQRSTACSTAARSWTWARASRASCRCRSSASRTSSARTTPSRWARSSP